MIAGIPREEIRHTRGVQDWLAEGRQEGEATVTIRLLTRRCCPLSEATTARLQSLPLGQLESLAEALLDFQGADDLEAWLASSCLTPAFGWRKALANDLMTLFSACPSELVAEMVERRLSDAGPKFTEHRTARKLC